MKYLKIKNWERHQHYKDRCPPWIKLHVKILNDLKFCSLSRASKCLLMLLWILASENDGFVPSDLTELRFRLRDDSISESEINQLIKGGFLNNCKQLQADDSKRYPETETETENNYSVDFSEFWNEYPNKVEKKKAFKKWQTLKKQKQLPSLNIILSSIKNQKSWRENANGEFRAEWKHPTTWLNAGCWDDEITTKPNTRLEDVG